MDDLWDRGRTTLGSPKCAAITLEMARITHYDLLHRAINSKFFPFWMGGLVRGSSHRLICA